MDDLDALRVRLDAMIDHHRQARVPQPERLADLRSQRDAARAAMLEAAPWTDCVTAVPTTDAETGELVGMLGFPDLDGKDLWGARLAFDVLDAAGDRERLWEALDIYFAALHHHPEHLMIVFASALRTIGEHVMPTLLESLERDGRYDHRVNLADAARNAWSTRLGSVLGD